jgi:hypothetical protein
MPARFAAQYIGQPAIMDRVSGTIWNGSAELDGSHIVGWQTSGWESLRRMAVVVNWRVTGPGTDLAGRIAVPLPARRDRAELDAIRGSVAWPLVEAALPGLPIKCDVTADVERLRVTLIPGAREGEGSISASPGICNRIDGAVPPVPTPALNASLTNAAEGLMVVVTQKDTPQIPLATARLTNDDRIIVTIHAAGAALVPGMPSSADSEIELPLTAVMP